jgi:succinate dehydrogenase / fumarate reductase, flavoprotein subunit
MRSPNADGDDGRCQCLPHEETIAKRLKIEGAAPEYQKVEIQDKGKIFNSDLLEAWELGCLLELAEVTAVSAIGPHRKPRRACPRRLSRTQRRKWLKHTLCHKVAKGGTPGLQAGGDWAL